MPAAEAPALRAPRARRRWWLAAHLVAAGSVSCTFITDTCACSLAPPVGLVYGTVGVEPPQSATPLQLEMRSHAGACGVPGVVEDHASQVVTPGPYRVAFMADTGRRCAIVTLRQDARFARDSVTMRVAQPVRMDSTRLDITLR